MRETARRLQGTNEAGTACIMLDDGHSVGRQIACDSSAVRDRVGNRSLTAPKL